MGFQGGHRNPDYPNILDLFGHLSYSIVLQMFPTKNKIIFEVSLSTSFSHPSTQINLRVSKRKEKMKKFKVLVGFDS